MARRIAGVILLMNKTVFLVWLYFFISSCRTYKLEDKYCFHSGYSYKIINIDTIKQVFVIENSWVYPNKIYGKIVKRNNNHIHLKEFDYTIDSIIRVDSLNLSSALIEVKFIDVMVDGYPPEFTFPFPVYLDDILVDSVLFGSNPDMLYLNHLENKENLKIECDGHFYKAIIIPVDVIRGKFVNISIYRQSRLYPEWFYWTVGEGYLRDFTGDKMYKCNE